MNMGDMKVYVKPELRHSGWIGYGPPETEEDTFVDENGWSRTLALNDYTFYVRIKRKSGGLRYRLGMFLVRLAGDVLGTRLEWGWSRKVRYATRQEVEGGGVA